MMSSYRTIEKKMSQFRENNNMIISDVPLPEDSGMSLVGYLYQAGVNDGLTPIENLAKNQTETDAMTGLFTKNAFFIQCESYLEKKKDASFCMSAVDINHFRLFNQVFGRKLGDAYIMHIADTLKRYVSEYGGIAGYGGADTFLYLAPDNAELFSVMEEDTKDYMRTQSLEVGYAPKFGVFRIIEDDINLFDAYDHAVTALEHVKKEYSRLLAWYDPAMDAVDDEFKLLQEVEFGLLNHEFTFYLQPKVELNTGKVFGAEALVRWIRRDNRIISPDRFIPALERNGFIFKLDKDVWEQVCKFQRFLIDMEYTLLPISVNVSRADLYSMDVGGYLNDLLKKYELPVSCIELEITESAYVEIEGDLENEIARIRSYGFRVAMDDFGCGYSSLSSLRRLDVDTLKVDMRLLDMDFSDTEKGVSILEFIMNMAETIGVSVIVEGVEFPDQVRFLTDIGCESVQGFYYHKPLRREVYEDILTDPEAITKKISIF